MTEEQDDVAAPVSEGIKKEDLVTVGEAATKRTKKHVRDGRKALQQIPEEVKTCPKWPSSTSPGPVMPGRLTEPPCQAAPSKFWPPRAMQGFGKSPQVPLPLHALGGKQGAPVDMNPSEVFEAFHPTDALFPPWGMSGLSKDKTADQASMWSASQAAFYPAPPGRVAHLKVAFHSGPTRCPSWLPGCQAPTLSPCQEASSPGRRVCPAWLPNSYYNTSWSLFHTTPIMSPTMPGCLTDVAAPGVLSWDYETYTLPSAPPTKGQAWHPTHR